MPMQGEHLRTLRLRVPRGASVGVSFSRSDLRVTGVEAGGAGEAAQLREGMQLVSIAGHTARDPGAVHTALRHAALGGVFDLVVTDPNRPLPPHLTASPRRLASPSTSPRRQTASPFTSPCRIPNHNPAAAAVVDIKPGLAPSLGLQLHTTDGSGPGALLVGVVQGTPAAHSAASGLTGWRLVRVGDLQVRDPPSAPQTVAEARGMLGLMGDSLRLYFVPPRDATPTRRLTRRCTTPPPPTPAPAPPQPALSPPLQVPYPPPVRAPLGSVLPLTGDIWRPRTRPVQPPPSPPREIAPRDMAPLAVLTTPASPQYRRFLTGLASPHRSPLPPGGGFTAHYSRPPRARPGLSPTRLGGH
eukprot:Hpha_TRINITY_DN23838_c0_g1::TRINITY_DN23838_c0_g1_i1::g.109968::m.109968